jgi:hypothetical protein
MDHIVIEYIVALGEFIVTVVDEHGYDKDTFIMEHVIATDDVTTRHIERIY